MAAKAATKTQTTTTTATTAPAKAPRIRKPKPKLVDMTPNAEEIAISKLAVSVTPPARKPKLVDAPAATPDLSVEDFALADADLNKQIADLQQDLRDARQQHDYAVSEMKISVERADGEAEHHRLQAAAANEKVTSLQTTIADLRHILGDARNQASTLGGKLDKLGAERDKLFTEAASLRVANKDLGAASNKAIAELKGKLASDREHISRLRAEVIRRQRLTFWQRVGQVVRPDGFDEFQKQKVLEAIRLDLVDGPEADALRGIQSSEGDLGILARKRITGRTPLGHLGQRFANWVSGSAA